MIRWSTNADHLLRPDLRPRPGRLPGWLDRLLPKDEHGLTLRVCPGVQDFYGAGWVVPLWCDVEVIRMDDPDKPEINVGFRVPEGYGFSAHPAGQQRGAPWLHGMSCTPKPLCPWYLETPPGVSVLVLPVEGQERRPLFEPIPGVIDTDVWHQMHPPCRWTRPPGDAEMVRMGTPLMHVIPFRREKWPDAEFRYLEGEELARVHGTPGGYRQLPRES